MENGGDREHEDDFDQGMLAPFPRFRASLFMTLSPRPNSLCYVRIAHGANHTEGCRALKAYTVETIPPSQHSLNTLQPGSPARHRSVADSHCPPRT